MSILDRLHTTGHLDDDELSEIWAAAAAEGSPAAHPHLSACAHCRARYAALISWLDGLREDAHGEADNVFTPERLAAQQAHVLRRLEALERPARVLAFPRFGRTATSGRSGAQRWIGAAAAAGLLVGLVAGQLFDLRHALDRSARVVEQRPMAQTTSGGRASGVTPASFSLSDEDLFYGVDASRASIGALEAIDAITPRSRDLDLPR